MNFTFIVHEIFCKLLHCPSKFAYFYQFVQKIIGSDDIFWIAHYVNILFFFFLNKLLFCCTIGIFLNFTCIYLAGVEQIGMKSGLHLVGLDDARCRHLINPLR